VCVVSRVFVIPFVIHLALFRPSDDVLTFEVTYVRSLLASRITKHTPRLSLAFRTVLRTYLASLVSVTAFSHAFCTFERNLLTHIPLITERTLVACFGILRRMVFFLRMN
jgi:hypothetical protein